MNERLDLHAPRVSAALSLEARNVVLTGFMGTGKTTVGRELARQLGFEFVDTDAIIENRHGPITSIFQERGEEAFRAIEREVARELADREQLVISTGGRMMLDPENVAALSRNGRVFCLVATPEVILNRITSDEARVERPLLAVPDPQQRVIELLASREPEYRRFAQITTDARSPEVIADDLATLVRTDPKRFAIDSPAGEYHFTVGAAILPLVRELAGIEGPLVVVTNQATADTYLASCPIPDEVITLPSDRTRQETLVRRVHDALRDAGIDRSATIMSLGDSIVGDVAAFAAATYLGGVDLVHCPTDLIAMIDTSVGGQVGLDTRHGRDLIGPYKQPKAVVADVATLQTLDDRAFAAGMAEVLKHALIAGSDLLDQLEAGGWSSSQRERPALGDMQALVAQAVQVKIAIVQEDPAESDRREVLDLGHTFADAFEQVDQAGLLHGEAVGIGLIAAARLSAAIGCCPSDRVSRIEQVVERLGLPVALPTALDIDQVVEAMTRDRKRRNGRQRFVLLHDIGRPFVSDEVPGAAVVDVLESVQP